MLRTSGKLTIGVAIYIAGTFGVPAFAADSDADTRISRGSASQPSDRLLLSQPALSPTFSERSPQNIPMDLFRDKYSAEGAENYLSGKPEMLHAPGMYAGSMPPLILGKDGPYMGAPLVEHYKLQPRSTNYAGLQDAAVETMSGFNGYIKESGKLNGSLNGASDVINPFSQYSSAFNVTSGTSSVSVGSAPGLTSLDMNPGFPNYSQFGGGVRRLYP